MSDPFQTAPRTQRPLAVTGDRGKRRVGLMLAGLGLVVGATFAFWYVLQTVDQRQPYVVAARDIGRWDVVSQADFELVQANVGDAAVTTANQMGAIYGRWATGSIPKGTFITPGMFQAPPLSSEADANSIVIEVSLPLGEVAYGTVQAGDTVALLGIESTPDLPLGFDGGDGLDDTDGLDTSAVEIDQDDQVLTLLGLLRVDFVQDGKLIYVVEPTRALQIQRLVKRYENASERQMWKMGIDLTLQDILDALRADAASADSVGVSDLSGEPSPGTSP